jgi:hypothetical protein
MPKRSQIEKIETNAWMRRIPGESRIERDPVTERTQHPERTPATGEDLDLDL